MVTHMRFKSRSVIVASPTGIAVARKAPDPFAAVLFWEYFLTDAQKILVEQGSVPSNCKVREPPPGLVFINPAKLLDEGDRWTKLYKDIFTGRSK
jgi:iron(III) transport system substrate-binding protein